MWNLRALLSYFVQTLGCQNIICIYQDLGILLSTARYYFIGSADAVTLQVVRTDAASIWATGRYEDFRAVEKL